MSYHDTAIVGIIYYCTRIGVSVLRTGRGRAGGGGGVEFLTEKNISLRNVPGVLKRQKNKNKIWGGGGEKFLSFFSLLIFFFKNVPGVLKRMQTKFIFRGGGGGFGVFGAPHAPTRGSRWVGKQYTSSYDHDM